MSLPINPSQSGGYPKFKLTRCMFPVKLLFITSFFANTSIKKDCWVKEITTLTLLDHIEFNGAGPGNNNMGLYCKLTLWYVGH